MKLLFTIPHFFVRYPERFASSRGYGSYRSSPQSRAFSLAELIVGLYSLFGNRTTATRISEEKQLVPVLFEQNPSYEMDIVICTMQDWHVLDGLPIEPNMYHHHAVSCEPMMLGFECQRQLAERFGQYDYYCFMEDDLVLQDHLFFLKLAEFNRLYGNDCLLQPNRFELSGRAPFKKAYVDGALHVGETQAFQDVSVDPVLHGETIFGFNTYFERALNPHSGCFFLNAEQMKAWMDSPIFGDESYPYYTPLESSATLGIMKMFKLYKPAGSCHHFLEIRHRDTRFIESLRPAE